MNRKLLRLLLWPLITTIFIGCGIASAAVLAPPTALVGLVGGDTPSATDVQWARGLVGFMVLVVLIVLAMVAAGLPSELSAGGFTLKRDEDDRAGEELRARLENGLETIEKGLALEAGLAANVDMALTGLEEVRLELNALRAHPAYREFTEVQTRLDEQEEAVRDLQAHVDFARSAVLDPGVQRVDLP